MEKRNLNATENAARRKRVKRAREEAAKARRCDETEAKVEELVEYLRTEATKDEVLRLYDAVAGNDETKQTKIRIAQLSCDWKDRIGARDIATAVAGVMKGIKGNGFLYDYGQDDVDSLIMYVSSIALTDEQLHQLWEFGDMGMSDKEWWEGENVDDIVRQVKKHLEETE